MLVFFKNRLLWIGLGIITLAASIFTFAFMGSTVNPTPRELPLAVVVEDSGVELPNGEQLNFGEMLLEGIKKNDTSSVNWKVFKSEEEAIDAMNEKELYGAVILPESLSQNIFSILTPSPAKPASTIIVNEGMNQVGANLANQIMNAVLTNFSQQIQGQLYNQIDEMKVPLTTELAKLVSSPITVETEKINTVATNNANGNTPALFTQVLWIGTFISSMILFTLLRKSTEGRMTFSTISSQILAGTLYVTFLSGVTLFLAVNILNVSVPDPVNLWMLMIFIGLCFFFIQNALLNWIGYAAAPIFILLLFFSMPILTIAPEMLPEVTRDYLYSWIPFRFSIERLKDYLFFGKESFESGIGVIGGIGLVSLFLMGLSVLKPTKKLEKAVEKTKEPETSF